jgi:hypothetical protein
MAGKDEAGEPLDLVRLGGMVRINSIFQDEGFEAEFAKFLSR